MPLGALLAFFGPPPSPGGVEADLAGHGNGPTLAHGHDLGSRLSRWRGTSAIRVEQASAEDWLWIRARSLDDWSDAGPGRDLVIARADLVELRERGVDFQLLVDDLEVQALAERERLQRNEDIPPISIFSPLYFDDFRELSTLEMGWAELATSYPQRVGLETIGNSVEGRPVQALRIGSPDAPRSVVFAFGQHAREWAGPATGTCFAHRAAIESEAQRVALLDEVQILLIPVVNPDGYVFTWLEDRFWRKNRSAPAGVDLNRNWASGFGLEPGSSSDPESNNYRGPSAFSEPETAAVRDFALAQAGVRAYVDIHSYSQLVLYPLSYLSELVPAQQGRSRAWAQQIAGTMSEVHGVDYVPLRGSDLYPASGVAMDWAFDAFDVPALTFELRPSGEVAFPTGFVLPPEQIVETCDEVELALWEIAGWALDGGPEPLDPPPVNPPFPADGGDGLGDASGDGSQEGSDESGDADGKPHSGSEVGTVGTEGSDAGRPDARDTVRTGCACALDERDSSGGLWLWLLCALPWRRSHRRRAAA